MTYWEWMIVVGAVWVAADIALALIAGSYLRKNRRRYPRVERDDR